MHPTAPLARCSESLFFLPHRGQSQMSRWPLTLPEWLR